jgi:hypothetical protein
MTQDSGDQETSNIDASMPAGMPALPGSQGNPKSQRKVAKTLLEADSPELKKIRKLLQLESPLAKQGKKVAKTLLDAPLPEPPEAKQNREVAKTLLDAPLPESPEAKQDREVAKTLLDAPLPQLAKPHSARKVARTMLEADLPELKEVSSEPEAESDSKAKRVERRQNFVAKTMLDHNVLADTLSKFEVRKGERAAEEARERASQPVIEIHPVDSKKLAQTCLWRWDDETSTDRFRYCPKCQTQAYNFDGLELSEAEALIFTRENKRNPTLYKRADGKFMTQDCPVQVKRKKRVVLFSIVGATLFFVFLTMVILMPPPSLSPKSGDATADLTEPEQPATGIRAIRAAERGASSREAKDGDLGVVKKNADGTRKRPTFKPEDEGAYWE